MGTIKVILKKDLSNLGEEGDVKIVKTGYARNFLFPNNYAVDYSKKNINALEKQRDVIEKKRLAKKDNAKELKDKLEQVKVTISILAGEKGRLYGTVTTTQVAEELTKLGFDIEKRKIEIKDHIKVSGIYKAYIHIYQDIYATIELEIKAKTEEKKHEQKGFRKKRRYEQQDENIENTENQNTQDSTTENTEE